MEQPRADDKNWTWVLDRPCGECGYESSTVGREELGALFRANAASWRSILSGGDRVSTRPPTTPDRGVIWSALEYGAHVRDVYDVFLKRVRDMLKSDDPTFNDWDQDRAAVDGNYGDEDPARVSYSLAVSAGKLADIVDRVSGDQWQRTGRRSDGSSFTVESILVYLLHDVTHHLHDVEQGFEALAELDD